MDLVGVIDLMTSRLPAQHVERLARELVSEAKPSSSLSSRLVNLVPTGEFAELAGRLCRAWEMDAGITGAGLAVALRAAMRSVETQRGKQQVEIVWTGPRTPEVPLRTTREVMVDVIRSAKKDLIIVSFAAYKVDVVVKELGAAAARGVIIRLILETGEKEGGTLTIGAAAAFKSLREKVSFYVWPTAKRPALEKGRAALHAKAVIADGHSAFVTSANLTGHAIAENMELGLLITGGVVPRRLGGHFRQLISDGVLELTL